MHSLEIASHIYRKHVHTLYSGHYIERAAHDRKYKEVIILDNLAMRVRILIGR